MKLFLHLLLAAGFLFLLGCGPDAADDGSNVAPDAAVAPPFDDGRSDAGADDSAAPPPAAKADPISVQAEKWYAEYKTDPKKFADQYAGQTILVQGTATKIGEEFPGQTYVLLQADDLTGVMCRFTNDPQPWATVAPGQQVTIRGDCPNSEFLSGEPILESCSFVGVGEGPKPISAEDLAKEYTTDRAATGEKYLGKPLIVTGKVKAIENRGSAKVVVLEGAGEADIDCWLEKSVSQPIDDLQPGQEARVIGELIALPDDVQNFPLSRCLLITRSSALSAD